MKYWARRASMLCMLWLMFGALPQVCVASGQWRSEWTFEIPANWEMTGTFEGVLNGNPTWTGSNVFANPTAETVIETWEFGLGVSETRTWELSYSPLSDGVPIVASSATAPIDPFNTVEGWLGQNGFDFHKKFPSPIAIADLNLNGEIDAGDASLYGELDLDLFLPSADAANFPLGDVFTTDLSGQVWDGLTFYLDDAFTTPFADGQILVAAISRDWAPAPGALPLFACALVVGRGRRRERRLRPRE